LQHAKQEAESQCKETHRSNDRSKPKKTKRRIPSFGDPQQKKYVQDHFLTLEKANRHKRSTARIKRLIKTKPENKGSLQIAFSSHLTSKKHAYMDPSSIALRSG
jgi:hypothetical protein